MPRKQTLQPRACNPASAEGTVQLKEGCAFNAMGRKLMQQAGAAGMAAGLASMGAQSLGALGSK